MKKLNLYFRAYNFGDAFSDTVHDGYFEFNLCFSREYPFCWFNAKTNTYSTAGTNPFGCLFDLIEHLHVGWIKYQHLKEVTRKRGFWQQL